LDVTGHLLSTILALYDGTICVLVFLRLFFGGDLRFCSKVAMDVILRLLVDAIKQG